MDGAYGDKKMLEGQTQLLKKKWLNQGEPQTHISAWI